MFVPHTCEIWTKSHGLNYTKFKAFWQKPKQTKPKKKKKKTGFWNHFKQSVDAILEDVSVAETIA